MPHVLVVVGIVSKALLEPSFKTIDDCETIGDCKTIDDCMLVLTIDGAFNSAILLDIHSL
jgi:hypothetical protein